MEFQFKIFSLNCWGIPIPGVSKDVNSRMIAIADFLARKDYDIVCLQEVWTDRDFNIIREKVQSVLPFPHYFYSGVIGSGICIFSKHPIKEAFFHQWSLNGYMHKIHHGDWYGGKGVGLCKITFNKYTINVYSAHLHAEYNRNGDEYEAHRILQAYDTAQFIMLTSDSSDLVVLAGDLNTEPGDLAHRVILAVPGLVEAFKDEGLPDNDIATCDNHKNSYTSTSNIKKNVPGQRIDYILYHPGSKMRVEVISYNQPLPDRIPGFSYSYSDHEAIESLLMISRRDGETSSVGLDEEEKKCVLEDCSDVLNQALNKIRAHRGFYILFFVVLLMLLLLSFLFDSPYGYTVVSNILRMIIVLIGAFCGLMAIIWNRIEMHGILAGKLAIDVSLRRYST